MDTKELKKEIKIIESLVMAYQRRSDPAWLADCAHRRDAVIASAQTAYQEAESVANVAIQDLEDTERRLRQLEKELRVRYEKPKIDRLRALTEKIRDLETKGRTT